MLEWHCKWLRVEGEGPKVVPSGEGEGFTLREQCRN